MKQLKRKTIKTNGLKELTERLLENQDVHRGYQERGAAIEAARLVKAMRVNAKLTQSELARLIDTQQPNIVALEAGMGARGPTMEMLKRVANACQVRLVIGFMDATNEDIVTVSDLRETFHTLVRKRQRTQFEIEAAQVVESIKWMSAV